MWSSAKAGRCTLRKVIMEEQKMAQFVALEVKSATGRATKEQSQFLEHITAAGGCAGVVRSVGDADLVLGAAIAPR